MSRSKLLVVSLVAACLCAGAASLSRSAAQPGGGPPPASVVVDVARLEMVEPRREVTGEFRAVSRSRVAAKEAGRIVEINVEAGDLVESGHVIARLDADLLDLDVRRAGAEVRRREGLVAERTAALEKAERDLKRVVDLQERSSATQTEADDRATIVSEAAARLEQSGAELEWARIDLERLKKRLSDMEVVAPFSGRVVARRTDIGEWVNDGDAVAELVALDPIDAWINVPQQFLEALRAPDRRIAIRIEATGEQFEAPVTAIIPDADPLSRMFPVRVRFENAAGALRPGMSVVGLIPTGQRQELMTIHKDAVLRDDAGAFVYFVAGRAAAVARVEPLFAVGDRLVVRAPALQPGAAVVVEGNERLFPGAPVAPRESVVPPVGAGPAAGRAESARGS